MHLSLWLGNFFKRGHSLFPAYLQSPALCPRLSHKGRRECGGASRSIYGKPRSRAHYFHPYSVVQSSVTWPNWSAREFGKCNLSAIRDRSDKSLLNALSLSPMPYSSQLWGFADTLPPTLECFPSLPAKSFPFSEALLNLFLEALPNCSHLWMELPITGHLTRGCLSPCWLAFCAQVWTAGVGRWEVRGHAYYIHMFKMVHIETYRMQ